MQHGLEHYIVKLLTQHDCAIVPNLGGFIVQHESARILPDSILPPHATVGFNPLLTHTDGHLAALLMRTEGVESYREASAQIEEQVSEWLNCLHQHEEVSLGMLGSLKESAEGQLIFTPGNLDFLPANFALTPIYRKQPIVAPKPAVTLRRSYLRYAACAALMLACFMPRQESDRYVDSATLDPTIWTRPTVIVEEAVVSHVEADTLVLASVSAPANVQSWVEEEKVEVSLKHHLIVASVDKNSAEQYCQELQSEGYAHAHVMPYKNGLYRVAICSYATRGEAVNAMGSLREQEQRFAKAWVFCE